MVAGMLKNHVVVACHVEHFGMRIVYLPVAVPGTQSLGNGACCIIFVYGLLHLSGCIYHADILALNHLVANAPRDDAWMIAVAQHHGMDVLSEAGVNNGRIIERILLRAPAIKRLVDNQHTYRVAGI